MLQRARRGGGDALCIKAQKGHWLSKRVGVSGRTTTTTTTYLQHTVLCDAMRWCRVERVVKSTIRKEINTNLVDFEIDNSYG